MIKLALASFGRTPPTNIGAAGTIALWLTCAVFVVWGLGVAIILNAFALLGGTSVRFMGRNGVEFRFFRFGRTPLIFLATPVLFCFFAWREIAAIGIVGALWPILAIPALAAALLAACAVNGWRKR